jgi:type II secretory pathway pseudopilin PulG
MYLKGKKNRGLSLVEVMITVVIVAMVGISILSGLAYGVYVQQAIRDRNGAMRLCADEIEACKRTTFASLAAKDIPNVILDDRGNTDASDDITGRLEVRFYDLSGVVVGDGITEIPLDGSTIKAEATIYWKPAGRRNADDQMVTIATLLAP